MQVVEYSLGMLAAIANNCAEFRDLLINQSIIQKVDLVLQRVNLSDSFLFDHSMYYKQNAFRLCANLCTIINNSIPDFDKVKDCLPFARIYINHENEDVRYYACRCFGLVAKINKEVCYFFFFLSLVY